MLTSTSAAPGSLLKHMVMVFRAILKKLVKDTDFPCNREALNIMSHGAQKEESKSKNKSRCHSRAWTAFFFFAEESIKPSISRLSKPLSRCIISVKNVVNRIP